MGISLIGRGLRASAFSTLHFDVTIVGKNVGMLLLLEVGAISFFSDNLAGDELHEFVGFVFDIVRGRKLVHWMIV